jgi:hypothetical protein
MMFEPADEGATGIALTAPMPAAETARNAAANKVFMVGVLPQIIVCGAFRA